MPDITSPVTDDGFLTVSRNRGRFLPGKYILSIKRESGSVNVPIVFQMSEFQR